MTLRRAIGLGAALVVAVAAFAGPPDSSVRPAPRPALELEAEMAVLAAQMSPDLSPRPAPRPRAATEAAAVAAAVAGAASDPVPAPVAAAPVAARDPVAAFLASLARPAMAAAAPLPGTTALAVARSPKPRPRPRDLVTRVVAASPPQATSSRGSICGVAAIKGERIADINGPGRCGVTDAVRVSSVSGVRLSTQPSIDCTTAKALNVWVRDGVIPAVGRTGGGVAQLNVIAGYSCRTRNNVPGAKLSEHALGHALDVAGITLADGTVLTVAKHWKSSRFGKIIKAMHKSACGPFGTVLGPDADRHHWNHIHVDTARYRGGPYCR